MLPTAYSVALSLRKNPHHSLLRGAGHSESFLLRGRTLAEFVDKTKGEKWRALAELLGLEAMDRLRRDFQRTRNSLKDEVGSATSDLTGKRAVLGQRMTEVSEIGVLDAIRERAATAGVQPPSTLSEALDPHWAQTVKPAESQDQLGVVLRAALSELGTLKDQMFVLAPIVAWNRFVDEGQQANHLRLGLHRAADSLLQAGYSDSGLLPIVRPAN